MLSSAGRSALTDHSKGKKHMEALNKRNRFFTPKSEKKSNLISKVVLLVTVSQQCSNLLWVTSAAICSEYRDNQSWNNMGLKSVFCGFSNRSCDELSGVFAKMFLDSGIAEGFRLGKTKVM